MDDVALADALHVLQSGTMEIEGVLPWSSNYAFLVTVCLDGVELPAVYKPTRGERPLWDFAHGTLSLREKAAFVVSEHLGWNLVPPTVLRQGEHGPGSIQLFIAHDPDYHYFSFEGDPLFRAPLQKMALLDYVINNADRKAGHVIIEQKSTQKDDALPNASQLWGIDHGICFHADYKLRTVIWEFAGEPIPPRLGEELDRFRNEFENTDGVLSRELAQLLSQKEITAMLQRTERLLQGKGFPNPGPGRHYPWPPV